MQAEASSSKAAVPTTPDTVLGQLQSLLTSQSSLTAALPYLHPYAPAPYKGKGKAVVYTSQDQIDLLQQLRQSVKEARTVLETATTGNDEPKVKLIRALKDVSTHQQSVIASSTAITTLAPSSSPLPSKRINLSPVDLLKTLSKSLDIQFYLEESQFGLLKTSLTLAGTCFVVDLDLETDAVAGNEEDDEMDVDARSEITGQEREGKGKVRLSKITANHVKGEATGKSDWIARVLRDRLERYLAVWNEKEKSWKGQMQVEDVIKGLEEQLRDLKELDDIAAASEKSEDQVDWFAEVEEVARKRDTLSQEGIIFASPLHTIYPAFYLLPATYTKSNSLFRLRPSRKHESIPAPFGSAEDIEEAWLRAQWIIECMGASTNIAGLVARRSWLADSVLEGQVNWDGLIRVEHLMYLQITDPSVGSGVAMSFPYTSDFVHTSKGSLDQRWAIAEPGPEGFIIGRMGVPRGLTGFQKLVELLRHQVVLNELFSNVFQPKSLDLPMTASNGIDGDGNDDDLLDDLLSGPPQAIAITVKLGQRSLEMSLPLPDGGDSPSALLSITLTPYPTFPFVELGWSVSGEASEQQKQDIQRGVDAAKDAGLDCVRVARQVVESCRQ